MKYLYNILLNYDHIKIIYFSFHRGEVIIVMEEKDCMPLPHFEKDGERNRVGSKKRKTRSYRQARICNLGTERIRRDR